jgi:hypothetical protein
LRYRISVGRKVYEYTVVEVDAPNNDEAEAKALQIAKDDNDENNAAWQSVEQPEYFVNNVEARPDLVNDDDVDSPVFQTFVADAIAKSPTERTTQEIIAIARAMKAWKNAKRG